jgi:hypothetical protein
MLHVTLCCLRTHPYYASRFGLSLVPVDPIHALSTTITGKKRRELRRLSPPVLHQATYVTFRHARCLSHLHCQCEQYLKSSRPAESPAISGRWPPAQVRGSVSFAQTTHLAVSANQFQMG